MISCPQMTANIPCLRAADTIEYGIPRPIHLMLWHSISLRIPLTPPPPLPHPHPKEIGEEFPPEIPVNELHQESGVEDITLHVVPIELQQHPQTGVSRLGMPYKNITRLVTPYPSTPYADLPVLVFPPSSQNRPQGSSVPQLSTW